MTPTHLLLLITGYTCDLIRANRSSIDSETNKLLQELIRREFAGYTIIAVDHHLENILDFDKIAVFDTGMLVEFGGPEELLGRASAFRELYGRGSGSYRVGELKEI